MTPEQFCYWLQGFFEIAGNDLKSLDEKRIQIIQDHLNLVFTKVTPDRRSKGEILNEEIRKAQMKRPNVTCSDNTRIC